MRKLLKRLNKCLKVNEIELLILSEHIRNEQSYRFYHLRNCYHCYKHAFKIRIFYQILFWELNKPISRQVKNLVKRIQEDKYLGKN